MTDFNAFPANDPARPKFGSEPENPLHPVGCNCWRCADWDNGEEDCAAARRHRLITTAQNIALHALPSLVIFSALYSTAAPRALEAAAAMVVVQQITVRIPGWNDSDAVEWGAIVVSGTAALAIIASAGAGITTLLGVAALTAMLTLWPRAFHVWRGSRVTDFELACGRPTPTP